MVGGVGLQVLVEIVLISVQYAKLRIDFIKVESKIRGHDEYLTKRYTRGEVDNAKKFYRRLDGIKVGIQLDKCAGCNEH